MYFQNVLYSMYFRTYYVPPTQETLLFLKGKINKMSPQHGAGFMTNCSLLRFITNDLSTILPKLCAKFTNGSFAISIPFVSYKPRPYPSSTLINQGSKRTSFIPAIVYPRHVKEHYGHFGYCAGHFIKRFLNTFENRKHNLPGVKVLLSISNHQREFEFVSFV